MLTGQHVFDGGSLMKIVGGHLHATPVTPSARTGRPLPAALEALVLCALAKDPTARPQTAKAMAAEFAECGLPDWTEARAHAWWAERRVERVGSRVAATASRENGWPSTRGASYS